MRNIFITSILFLSVVTNVSSVQAQTSSDFAGAGIEPLQGDLAVQDNAREVDSGSAALTNGLQALVTICANEGQRRLLKLQDLQDPGYDAHLATFDQALRDVNVCFDGCSDTRERCFDIANIAADRAPFFEASCRIEQGICEARCGSRLTETIALIPDLELSSGMEDQTDIALQTIFAHEVDRATFESQIGTRAVGQAALEEGIRATLNEYSEYGVPAGATLIEQAGENWSNCQERNDNNQETCLEGNTLGIIGEAGCAFKATGNDLICAGDSFVTRWNPLFGR